MTSLPLAASLLPLLAAGEVDTLLKVADIGTTMAVMVYGLLQWTTGEWRRKGEVEEAQKREAETEARRIADLNAAENRAAVERARADREADNRNRIQEGLVTDLLPALAKVAVQGEQMVTSNARIAELFEEIVRAFIRSRADQT